MIYRKYQPEDDTQLRAIHSQREYSYPFIELSSPEFASVWVAEDEGRLVAAVAARKVVEISALVDENYSNPAWRLHVMQALQEHGSKDLASQGFTEMVCWVKREVSGFGRRLVKSMGWARSKGETCFVKGV